MPGWGFILVGFAGTPAGSLMAGWLGEVHIVGLLQPLPGHSLSNDRDGSAHICEPVDGDDPCRHSTAGPETADVSHDPQHSKLGIT